MIKRCLINDLARIRIPARAFPVLAPRGGMAGPPLLIIPPDNAWIG